MAFPQKLIEINCIVFNFILWETTALVESLSKEIFF